MGNAKCSCIFFKLKAVPVEGQTRTVDGKPCPHENKPKVTAKNRVILELSHTIDSHFKLPKSLIGTKSTAQVKIVGNT